MREAIIFCLIILMSGISCKRKYAEEKSTAAEQREQLLKISHEMVQKESKEIDDFIARHQWKMEKTGDGLRYDIYLKGTGRLPSNKDTVRVSYKIFLLDGTMCYEAPDSLPLRMVIGNNEILTGLEEAISLMNVGSSAHVVLPSHLAYGLSGDGNKIPPASALYFDLHLISAD